MPAVPLIGMGISAYMSYKQAKSMGKMAAGQEALMGKQTGLSDELATFARGQHTMAEPALNKAMQYYMQLAAGNRGKIDETLAPDRAALNETYRGAERGLTSRMAAGPSRDRAIAELYRSRAGQLGLMPMMARTNAMGALNSMGSDAMQRALQGYGQAGNALTGASNTGYNAMTARNQANQAWGDFAGNMTKVGTGIYDWWKRRQGGMQHPMFGPMGDG